MHRSNRRQTCLILAALAALAAAPAASAESWICEHSTLVREINVERTTADPAPCSVAYNKQSEGQGVKILWSAQHEGSYCDAKANGLADKLQGLGWSCSAF
jgi:hypothetical protein